MDVNMKTLSFVTALIGSIIGVGKAIKENKLKEWHKEFQKQEENVMDDVVTAQSYRE